MMSQKYIQPSLFPKEELQEDISSEKKKYDLTNLFERLAKSDFRSRFHLSKQDREYVMEKGLPTIRKHAEDFVAKRFAPAVIPNDGKQTPMRGHPVFLAQPTPSREQYQDCLNIAEVRRRKTKSTCHWLLLPRMLLQVASYPGRQNTDQGGTGLCCCRIDGID